MAKDFCCFQVLPQQVDKLCFFCPLKLRVMAKLNITSSAGSMLVPFSIFYTITININRSHLQYLVKKSFNEEDQFGLENLLHKRGANMFRS